LSAARNQSWVIVRSVPARGVIKERDEKETLLESYLHAIETARPVLQAAE
jgi:hypothetical protein